MGQVNEIFSGLAPETWEKNSYFFQGMRKASFKQAINLTGRQLLSFIHSCLFLVGNGWYHQETFSSDKQVILVSSPIMAQMLDIHDIIHDQSMPQGNFY